jgi:Protein of unknown function (DUF2585)
MTAMRGVLPVVAVGTAIIAVAALILAWLGHPWICTCGTVKLWHGVTLSSENSQHLSDWYTPSHVIHGILFYFGLWLVARRWPLSTRVLIALAIEAAWEVIENTPWIIDRYREVTISLDYYGDSVINSVADILAMLVGFWLAARAPVWLSAAVVIALEAIVGTIVRDNLTLNIIMLIYPLVAIRNWQAGG